MRSIRARLLLSLLVVLAAGAAIAGASTYRTVLADSETQFDNHLRDMAITLRDQGATSIDSEAALADENLDFVVQIWGPDGTTIYRSQPFLQLPSRAVIGYSDVQLAGASWRVYTMVSRDRVIQVAQPLRIRRDVAAHAALRGVLPLLALAPLLGLAVWWQVGASLASLGRLAADVKRRDDEALDPLPQRDVPAEVEPLVGALNALLSRLRRAFATQAAFVADAAHELRSPLTALKLQLKLLRRAPDESARQQALAALGSGIERAIHLVEQLLALARSEPGADAAAGTGAQPLDLAETVRLAVADVVPQAAARGTQVELYAERPVALRGEAGLLRVLARNLVDNAVRYAPAGGRVEVRVDRVDGRPRLTVDDSGPGIPAAERARVFDRFYRRGTGGDDDAGGSGLGLAIVRRIAERHQASVELGDAPLGGLRAAVRFRD